MLNLGKRFSKQIIPLCKPDLGLLELREIRKNFSSGGISHGPEISKFEIEFAKLIGTKYAVSANSWTSAAYLVFKYIRETYGEGEVILPSFSFVASANVIRNAGLIPVFADIDEKSKNITVETIKRLVSKKTLAIMPVHFGGLPCDMKSICAFATKNNLLIIEDSAECIGAETNGSKAGSFGIGIFSFYATKNLTTGEGGMVTTNDKQLEEWLRLMLAHGIKKTSYFRDGISQPWFRNSLYSGHNFRLSNLQATIGLIQLKKLTQMNIRRYKVAKLYNQLLANNANIKLPILFDSIYHSYQMYVIQVPPSKRDSVVLYLRSKKIEASVHFDPPIHFQDVYKIDNLTLPVTELCSRSVISLPISSHQRKRQTIYIAKTLIGVL